MPGQRYFFAKNLPEDEGPEDELDELFMKNLPRLAPPPELIAQILSNVAHLPLPGQQLEEEDDPFCGLDSLVVRKEKQSPS